MKAKINGNEIYMIDGVQTVIYHVRGNVAKGAIFKSDLTLDPCFIVKQNDVFAHGETLQAAQEALMEKLFDGMPEEDRIAAFMKEYPTLDTVVKNTELFDWHGRLTGSCEFGRRAFATDHGIDMTASMTVRSFVELTKNAYGGDIIRRIEDEMKGEHP